MPNRLAELGLPVLVIFGSEDRRWLPSFAQDYHTVPQARIEILDGVGHTPMLEDPDTTAALIRSFAIHATAGSVQGETGLQVTDDGAELA